jgi:hypothetical protein
MPESVIYFQIRTPPALNERLASQSRKKSSPNTLVVVQLAEAVARGHSDSSRRGHSGCSCVHSLSLPCPSRGRDVASGIGLSEVGDGAWISVVDTGTILLRGRTRPCN